MAWSARALTTAAMTTKGIQDRIDGMWFYRRFFRGRFTYALVPRSLRLALNMVRDHEPAAIDSLVDVCGEPIDFADGTVLHVCLSNLSSNLPSKIANHMNMRDT